VKLSAIGVSRGHGLLSVGTGANGTTGFDFRVNDSTDGSIRIEEALFGTTTYCVLVTTPVYRDPSAWYHIVLSVDTTQATSSDRVKLYVNGSQVTSFSSSTYPSLNYDFLVSSATQHNMGVSKANGVTTYADEYLTEINFIGGQALTPSSFGETDATTGAWKPKRYAGTYGTNGFYINFSDNSDKTATTIGKDYSGNGNNWTPNSISITAGTTYDSMLDVPTLWADGGNGRGNYANWNPIVPINASSTITNANLQATLGGTAGTNANGVLSTFKINSGKWYAEFTLSTITNGGTYPFVGITGANSLVTSNVSSNSASYCIRASGNIDALAVFNTGYGSSFANGDVCQIAVDFDAGKIWYGKNGTWFASGNPASGTSPSSSGVSSSTLWAFAVSGDGNAVAAANFGQRPFAYTPPSGYKALNTQNFPEPTIKKGSDWFDAKLDTGANIKATAEATFTGDELVWIKDRANINNHQLIDSVRGTSAVLQSNTTAAETTYTAPSGNSVGWVWKEGATPGFDIVAYTGNGTAGRTIAHSLGVAPQLIISKCRSSSATNWPVFGSLLGANKYLLLNSTAASATGSPGYDNGTLATSSVFSVGSQSDINSNGATYIAYLFAEVSGFSKFGSYTGNGSSDGPFVFCGFRPRFIMWKRTDSTSDWVMQDTAVNTINVSSSYLVPNTSAAEGSFGFHDIVSNGFKLRQTNSTWNVNGGTYIFAAFAENPFKYSLAR